MTTFRLPRRFILRSGAVGSRASAFAKAMADNCAHPRAKPRSQRLLGGEPTIAAAPLPLLWSLELFNKFGETAGSTIRGVCETKVFEDLQQTLLLVEEPQMFPAVVGFTE